MTIFLPFPGQHENEAHSGSFWIGRYLQLLIKGNL